MKLKILSAIGIFASIVVLSLNIHLRMDLTAEKRFSLSEASKKLLLENNIPVKIIIYLNGNNLSPDYKQLSIATHNFLEEVKRFDKGNIEIIDEIPGEKVKNDTLKAIFFDSLANMGLTFERANMGSDLKNAGNLNIIFPSALIITPFKKIAVDLRSSKKIYKQFDVIDGIEKEDMEATRNSAEALLEYKFINSIHKITRIHIPTIAYLVGNGEPIDKTINDLGECLRYDYKLSVLDLKKSFPNPNTIDLLILVKPTQNFTDEDKLRLDQYLLHGGRMIAFIDVLHAEIDSLMRSKSEYVAYQRDLNIGDLFFKYGVRINPSLLQDLNCAKIPLVFGYNPDNSPKMQRVPWPYYPLLSDVSGHPISKNIDKVLPIFPCYMDTLPIPGVKKTILLATDSNSRFLGTPSIVSVNSVKDESDFHSFNKSHLPVSVLLEGSFKSLFANRLTNAMKDSFLNRSGKPFEAYSTKPGKLIVSSDADLVTNVVSPTQGPLQMGELPFDNYQFANKQFLLNCVDYLTDDQNIFVSRNKEFILRVLDKKKINDSKTLWQIINIVVPVLFIALFGVFFDKYRKNKFANQQQNI